MTIHQKRISFLLPALLFSFVLTGCDYGRMYNQETIKTYKAEIPEMPQGTIPVSDGRDILKRSSAKELKNYLPSDKRSVEQGKQAYAYFCIHCHGVKADGNGTVGQSFVPLPTNLTNPAIQTQTDGDLFFKISLGFRRHPPLATTISDHDRWAVVHYLRSLNKKPAG